MKKQEAIFRIVSVAALALAAASLVRREAEIRILNETHRMIQQHINDESFVDIVNRYNEDGD